MHALPCNVCTHSHALCVHPRVSCPVFGLPRPSIMGGAQAVVLITSRLVSTLSDMLTMLIWWGYGIKTTQVGNRTKKWTCGFHVHHYFATAMRHRNLCARGEKEVILSGLPRHAPGTVCVQAAGAATAHWLRGSLGLLSPPPGFGATSRWSQRQARLSTKATSPSGA